MGVFLNSDFLKINLKTPTAMYLCDKWKCPFKRLNGVFLPLALGKSLHPWQLVVLLLLCHCLCSICDGNCCWLLFYVSLICLFFIRAADCSPTLQLDLNKASCQACLAGVGRIASANDVGVNDFGWAKSDGFTLGITRVKLSQLAQPKFFTTFLLFLFLKIDLLLQFCLLICLMIFRNQRFVTVKFKNTILL